MAKSPFVRHEAYPGHVGVPGGHNVVGHLVHGSRDVLQRLGAHQAVCKVHHVQEWGHCCCECPIVVCHALHMDRTRSLNSAWVMVTHTSRKTSSAHTRIHRCCICDL